MNVNTNVNNMMNQMPNNMFPVNNQPVAMDKSFINMLAKMSGKSDAQMIAQPIQGSANLNIMEILTGNNLMDPMPLDNINAFGTENEEKADTEKMPDNFMEMENIYNFGTPVIMNNDYQKSLPNNEHIYNSNSSIMSNQLNVDTVNYDYSRGNVAFDFKTSEGQLIVNNNNGSKTEHLNILNNLNVEVEAEKNLEVPKAHVNLSAEKLISEIEGHRDKLKNEIDSQVGMLVKNRPLIDEQNKIINISDESTELKPQIMSQVKDTIVFMAKEGPEPGSTIRNVTMELHPVHLGKVEIKMTYEDNKVTVEIKALNEETQKIIASNADELANILGKSSEAVNIVVKSADSRYEHQLYNYHNNNDSNGNEQNLNQDEQNNGHGRQKNNYYYNDDDKIEDDDTFSQLINLRNVKLNV